MRDDRLHRGRVVEAAGLLQAVLPREVLAGVAARRPEVPVGVEDIDNRFIYFTVRNRKPGQLTRFSPFKYQLLLSVLVPEVPDLVVRNFKRLLLISQHFP